MMLENYINEFVAIAVIHLLAVASPGPDFAIILKQSIRHGRKIALYTSVGIGTGILIHVAYSLVGLGVLIASSPAIFAMLKYIAAAYFCYIAWHGLRAKAPEKAGDMEPDGPAEEVPTAKKAFLTGFFINGLNIKATLFFIALYSVVIAPTTPTQVKLVYGIYMAIATCAWFSFLSYMLSMRKVRQLLVNKGYWVERIMGAVLLYVAVELVLGDLKVAST